MCLQWQVQGGATALILVGWFSSLDGHNAVACMLQCNYYGHCRVNSRVAVISSVGFASGGGDGRVLQCVAVCVAMCCSALQCVVVFCSLLQ